jgi:hypothetical protein
MGSHQLPHRGITNTWLTPPEIIEAVGPFDLDPCAAIGQPWETAGVMFTEHDDGMVQDWHGFVWCNPPFGPEAGKWLDRLAMHGNGIGLIAARTETRWFVRVVWEQADAVLFLHGRPHFHHIDGSRAKANSGVPICLVAYGAEAVERLDNCGLDGSLVTHWSELDSGSSEVPR